MGVPDIDFKYEKHTLSNNTTTEKSKSLNKPKKTKNIED